MAVPRTPAADPRALAPAAHVLAARLPALLVEAKRVAATVAFGTHGRRRQGPGETFWQFRPYDRADPAAVIDWRRSAASDHLYVREREWEAAHTLNLWADLSPSMQFQSRLAGESKRDRALVLLLALAELLGNAGERVGALGLVPPRPGRRGAERLALALSRVEDFAPLPPAAVLSRFGSVVMISDFLETPADIAEAVNAIAGQGVSGHLVQLLDPAEETLPYEGRIEFTGPDGRRRHLAERAETLRTAYAGRLAAQRDAVAGLARRLGWTFAVHHTDRPPAHALLALHAALSGAAPYRAGEGAAARVVA